MSAESLKLRRKGDALQRKACQASYDARLLNEAVTAYKAALALDPKDYAALNNLGVAYCFRAAFPLSAATLKKALALKPRDPAIRRNLYYMRLNMGGASALSKREMQILRALPDGEPGLLEVYFDAHGM